MSRTFRRKSETKAFMRAYGCINYEYDTYYCSKDKRHKPLWQWRWHKPEFNSYDDYLTYNIARFHADGNKNFTNYNSAPREWRNFRNRKLRAAHRNAVKAVRDFDDDVVLEPFIHNVGWDYW